MCLQNIYDYNHINNVENDDDDDEHMCLKYGKTNQVMKIMMQLL